MNENSDYRQDGLKLFQNFIDWFAKHIWLESKKRAVGGF